MFGQNNVTFGAALWVCLCLIGVSLFAGVLLGDRYRPFQHDSTEARVGALENRVGMLEVQLQATKKRLSEAGIKDQ